MYIHRFAAVAAVVPLLLLSAACGQDSDYCQALKGTPSLFCPNNPTGGTGGLPPSCAGPEASLWECNVVGGPNTVPLPISGHNHPGMCGSFYCASSLADAQNQTGAAGDPSLSCVPCSGIMLVCGGGAPPWTSCITPCNPCDDGQGGTLQNVGEHCGGPYTCCQGLTCVGAMASTMGTCQGTPQCATKAPALVPLTTTQLRAIAAANGIGAGQTGIAQSRTIGLAFENWVLTTMGQIPRYKAPLLPSPRRQQKTGGLPGSVLPEYVADLDLWWPGQGWPAFDESLFFEVKAVTGVLALNTSSYQILGLIDVASRSTAGVSAQPTPPATACGVPPPALVFTTTGNTNLDLGMLQTATQLCVAVWQQIVMYDANSDPNNPDLYIDQALPANQAVYGAAVPLPMHPVWPHSPLTSPTSPPMPVPNDPDPPEVD